MSLPVIDESHLFIGLTYNATSGEFSWWWGSGTSFDHTKTPGDAGSTWTQFTGTGTHEFGNECAQHSGPALIYLKVCNYSGTARQFDIMQAQSVLPSEYTPAVMLGYDPDKATQIWDFIIDGDPVFKIKKNSGSEPGTVVSDATTISFRKSTSAGYEYAATYPPVGANDWKDASGGVCDVFGATASATVVALYAVNDTTCTQTVTLKQVESSIASGGEKDWLLGFDDTYITWGITFWEDTSTANQTLNVRIDMLDPS